MPLTRYLPHPEQFKLLGRLAHLSTTVRDDSTRAKKAKHLNRAQAAGTVRTISEIRSALKNKYNIADEVLDDISNGKVPRKVLRASCLQPVVIPDERTVLVQEEEYGGFLIRVHKLLDIPVHSAENPNHHPYNLHLSIVDKDTKAVLYESNQRWREHQAFAPIRAGVSVIDRHAKTDAWPSPTSKVGIPLGS